MSSEVGWPRAETLEHDVPKRLPPRRSRRRPVVALILVLLGGAVLVSVVLTHRADAGHRTYDGLTVRYPTNWHPVDRQFNTGALDAPLGYLTNQSPETQCSKTPSGQTACHAPVTNLRPDGVLVTISLQPSLGGSITATGEIDGLPAAITRHLAEGCPTGAAFQIVAEIQAPSSKLFTVNACLGARNGQARQAVEHMLSTTTYG